MTRRNRTERPPVEILLDRLEPKALSGLLPSGKRVQVRNGGVGARLLVRRGRGDEVRRLAVVEPAPDAVTPVCPAFHTCGGCQLQEMPVQAQRAAKRDLVARVVNFDCEFITHATEAYGYRNKLELSFGRRQYFAEGKDDPDFDETRREGDFLGLHPPGWFSAVVPLRGCPLASEAMNRAIAEVVDAAPGPAWDNRAHTGCWRHVVVRQGDDGVLVTLVTHSATPEAEVRALADRLAALPEVAAVLWVVQDGLAEVASGELRAVLHGAPVLRTTLGGVPLELPYDAFFQVNPAGAERLLDTIASMLWGESPPASGTLLDLYCGVGAIGLALHRRAPLELVGVELHAGAIGDARANAARLGVAGQWHAGPVEDVLPGLRWADPTWVVVDPPRAGLHPKAAAFLANLRAEALVYVACNPASLGRDRAALEAGGWRLERLAAVDLFPQTTHVEAVGRFVRV